jgi:hypothetical protein
LPQGREGERTERGWCEKSVGVREVDRDRVEGQDRGYVESQINGMGMARTSGYEQGLHGTYLLSAKDAEVGPNSNMPRAHVPM